MSSAHSYTIMHLKPPQNDDDDDICPVCESECTCNKNTSTPNPTLQLTPPHVVAAATAPPAPPLKIKLPARTGPPSSSKNSAKRPRPRPKSSKPKQTTVVSGTIDGAAGPSDYVVVPRAPSPIPPSNAVFSLRDTSPLTPEPELEPSSSRSKPPKKKSSSAISRSKQSAQQKPKKKTSVNKSRKNKDETWTAASQRRRKGKRVHASSDESDDDLTEEDTYLTRMAVESDGTESVLYPTFVSASAMSSISDSEATTTSLSDSFDSDSSIRAEEENLILNEEARAKVRRELLNNNNNEEPWHMEKRKWDHLKNNNNWEIRPRKRSVGPDESATESESESETEMEVEEEEEDEEAEADEDDDPDIRYGRGLVTVWQSSDEDEDFDMEVFFATLTDSSGPGSDADAEDSGDETDGSDLSSISMTEAVAAGLLHTAQAPLVVTEDWDGRLVFTDGLKDGQGIFDVHFEVNAQQRQRDIREAMEMDVDEAPEEHEKEADVEEDQEDLISDDDGETTDDMLDHSGPHVPPSVSFRFPTPPTASIDPLSTLSPIVTTKRNKLLSHILTDSPKPADILANSSGYRSRSASVVPSPPGTSISSLSQARVPKMGSFVSVSPDPKKRAVLDGKTLVNSPFSRLRRLGRGRERKRLMFGTDFQHPSRRARQTSLPGDTRCPFTADAEEPLVQSSPELELSMPTSTSMGLDDVLDASFLESDESDSGASATTADENMRNLSRWERVPMGTFRRTRASHVALVNDGVSYGAGGASGHVLRRSAGAAFWKPTEKPPQRRSRPGSVAVSPVIFPVRDGERGWLEAIEEFDFEDLDALEAAADAVTAATRDRPRSHKQKRREKKDKEVYRRKDKLTMHNKKEKTDKKDKISPRKAVGMRMGVGMGLEGSAIFEEVHPLQL
ncbi:hypothetical protein M422DRAFT_239999 [Sphaerobolus stellatus SS14]|nr:hypothetical protein M422DRAFT_239999 [Sphaerobolus stellatus SS14]